MGFGADGILVYGRYLYDTQLGYQEPMLDNCGGHQHTTSATSAQDPYGLVDEYHYHAQIFDAYADSSAVADEGDFFTASTTGPYNCYRANLTASKGSMALYEAADALSEGKGTMSNRCCGMTDYYILTGEGVRALMLWMGGWGDYYGLPRTRGHARNRIRDA